MGGQGEETAGGREVRQAGRERQMAVGWERDGPGVRRGSEGGWGDQAS